MLRTKRTHEQTCWCAAAEQLFGAARIRPIIILTVLAAKTKAKNTFFVRICRRMRLRLLFVLRLTSLTYNYYEEPHKWCKTRAHARRIVRLSPAACVRDATHSRSPDRRLQQSAIHIYIFLIIHNTHRLCSTHKLYYYEFNAVLGQLLLLD